MATHGVVYDLINEKLLLHKISMGDEAAFKEVFDTYKGRVFTFVENFIHSRADAEEIVQETFLSLWQQRNSLTSVEHPRNYIYTLVRNKTMRYIGNAIRDEKMQRIILANMQSESNSTQEDIEFRESKKRIDEAIARLPEQKQKIFRMCREEGLSHEYIAAETGLSRSRVKNIMVEVLRYVRLFLAREGHLMVLFVLLKKIF
ncbi:RNA polymerase sigma-70 factor [Pedobacter sp.]|jgi:RNA polymerase sigma-70 factor (family 1)|uniref:RNA polymerase sigma-70 factor n=1 Tax=Pedobacter sp. TaxID=1411316 RepID=UPI002BAE2936|nr:RNA polymerase sigma-70 factor [Pedobacter sp.]HWW38130.1 RNA polymerase sigma-70 factor [Pedobacter sp.]